MLEKKPTNIDFLNYGRECNQVCRQCFYQEVHLKQRKKLSFNSENEIINKLSTHLPISSFFLYPKEITTNPEALLLIQKLGQESVLSNGKNINLKFIQHLKSHNIKTIKITLFGTFEEQYYYNKNTEEEYQEIKDNIALCVSEGIEVEIGNILAKNTMNSIELLCKTANTLGVKRVNFFRLRPHGSGANIPKKYLLQLNDLKLTIIPTIEKLKKQFGKKLFLSMQINFGPNFYGKTFEQAKAKVQKSLQGWTASPYICPAIDGNYWGISTKTNKVYSCFDMISHLDIPILGTIDSSSASLIPNSEAFDLSAKKLKENLRGKCSKNSCIYQAICLGGCRSTAYVFSKQKKPEDRIYDEMDICLTKIYEELYGQK